MRSVARILESAVSPSNVSYLYVTRHVIWIDRETFTEKSVSLKLAPMTCLILSLKNMTLGTPFMAQHTHHVKNIS